MRTLLLYAALVGAALAGLAGILRAGERLDAPRSASGAWTLAFAGAAGASAACPWRDRVPGPLRVEQSGERLALRFGAAAPVPARLRGDVLRARVDAPPGAACRAWTLDARLEGPPVATALAGTLAAEGCPCPPADFRATRDEGRRGEVRK